MLLRLGLFSCSLGLLLTSVPAISAAKDDFWKASGSQGAVVAGTPEAADAASEILHRGNAIDAAVAAILVLSVTDAGNFCFGGEVPIMVYDAKRKVVEVLCGQGSAPRLATIEYFEKHKGGRIPGDGDPTTAAVPAALDACLTALDRYGTLTFTQVVGPALKILDRHDSPWQADLAKTLHRLVEAETGVRGRPPPRTSPGRRLLLSGPDRPRDRRLEPAARRPAPLHRPGDARHADRGAGNHRVSRADRLQVRAVDARALPASNAPAAGKVRSEGDGPQPAGLRACPGRGDEARPGRSRYLLCGPAVCRRAPPGTALAASTPHSGGRSWTWPRPRSNSSPETPSAAERSWARRRQAYRLRGGPLHDTTTCIVADRQGNVVAATPSGWGGVTAGSTGVTLGSRLRSFNLWRGHPNCIEPGKRPRITLSPTLVLRGGRAVAAISVAGGDQQDQVTLQLLLDYVEFGLSPADAVTAPRFITNHLIGSFNQPPPQLGNLVVEESLGRETIDALRARGHRIQVQKPPLGHPVMLVLDPATGQYRAAGDPKAGRHARAY